MNFEHRYDRNTYLGDGGQAELARKRVLITGLGGLGGYVLEELVRTGVGRFAVCDYDVFSESNLNRQLLCTEANLGHPKVTEAVKRACEINSEVEVRGFDAGDKLEGLRLELSLCDLAIDCLDTARDRLVLAELCREYSVPLIHGAIDGWFAQISTVMPGNNTLELLYANDEEPASSGGNAAFTAAVAASLQASEAVKVLLGLPGVLTRRVLTIDLLHNDFQIIDL